jgi:hypothetical protein
VHIGVRILRSREESLWGEEEKLADVLVRSPQFHLGPLILSGQGINDHDLKEIWVSTFQIAGTELSDKE